VPRTQRLKLLAEVLQCLTRSGGFFFVCSLPPPR